MYVFNIAQVLGTLPRLFTYLLVPDGSYNISGELHLRQFSALLLRNDLATLDIALPNDNGLVDLMTNRNLVTGLVE